jgi:predicted NAD-dependent protein-ADP-ribosyltransferase YbiA (DUF1768 family)
MKQYKAEYDGITHINVYSKSKSPLGRLISNFAYTPVTIDSLLFESIESWWYWTKMKRINEASLFSLFSQEQLDEIRIKVGADAKEYFRAYFKDDSSSYSPTKEELKKAYLAKLDHHPNIKDLLLKNHLPLAHYYMMWDKQVNADSTLWTAQLWEEIKKELTA